MSASLCWEEGGRWLVANLLGLILATKRQAGHVTQRRALRVLTRVIMTGATSCSSEACPCDGKRVVRLQ